MASSESTPERWLPVVGYEGLYEVSDLGRVRGLDRVVNARKWRGAVMNPSKVERGCFKVALSSGGRKTRFYVHRLVLTAFCRQPKSGEHANHIDFNPSNNRLDNLEWATPHGNMAHSVLWGRTAHGERNNRAKLTPSAVADIRVRFAGGERQEVLANEYGITQTNVSLVCLRKTWRRVP